MTGKNKNLAEELTYRGLVFQHTGETLEAITNTQRTLYLGVDPTGDSLHVGHLLQFMIVRRFLEHGHKVIVLLGGGTATIGDPSGKTEERVLLDDNVVKNNTERLRSQITTLLGGTEYTLVDNAEWLMSVPILDFLRDVGKHFTVNDMLRKESVRRRIEDPDSAISFTEFSYMLLQAFDFYILSDRHGCDLQLGGSDQWGNITAGVELVRKKGGKEVHGITAPLLVDPTTGRKFGKTEGGGAVWLDPKKTSPFQYFQFWYNTQDESAREYIKYYTTLEKEEIETLVADSLEHPEERRTQSRLAFEATKLVHGEEEANRVRNISFALFKGTFDDLDATERETLLQIVPSHGISSEQLQKEKSVTELLTETGLATSNRDARTLVTNGGVTLAGKKVEQVSATVTKEDFSKNNNIVLLKKGKRDVVLLHML